MPQLVLFGRRWKVASDFTIPLVMAFLAIFHAAFLVPLLIVTGTTESQDYTCDEKFKVRFALLGLLLLYLLSLFNETTAAVAGARGGPLEEHRRRIVRPLVYVELILWFLILGWTCYGTYIAASPSVGTTCWADNPCQYSTDGRLQAMCTLSGTEETLTPACQEIYSSDAAFSRCFDNWADYAATAMIQQYRGQEYDASVGSDVPVFAPFNVSSYVCDRSVAMGSKNFLNFINKAFGTTEADAAAQENVLLQLDRLTLGLESVFLTALGIPHSNNTAGSDAPWADCDPGCAPLIASGDACGDWQTLVNLPDSHNRKAAFLGTVYASWGMLVVQALIAYGAFNAWPDYESEESWEGTVRRTASMMCCLDKMEGLETEDGKRFDEDIARLLHTLFGGIDLDFSDQVLGMYLVAERQRLARRRYALAALKASGLELAPVRRSMVQRAWAAVRAPFRRAADWFNRRDDVRLRQTLEDDEMSRKGTGGGKPAAASAAAAVVAEKEKQENSIGCDEPPQLVPLNSESTAATEASRRNWAHTAPELSSTFVRLEADTVPENTETEAEEENGNSDGEPSPAKSAASLSPAQSALPAGKMNRRLVAASRERPLVTPVALRSLNARLPVSSYEASRMYGISEASLVEPSILEDALRYSRFAAAAYGLKDSRWDSPAALEALSCPASTCDAALACAPCGPARRACCPTHFRQRNYSAIMHVAGIAPADLLHVSYVNSAAGIVPYLLLVDRTSRSVVLSLRGTVGLDDMLTDLLSSPVDAGPWLPAWVREAAGPDVPLLAHAGILSSARAVLRDLEEKGLIDAMVKQANGGKSGGSGDATVTTAPAPVAAPTRSLAKLNSLGSETKLSLDLSRAQSVVGEAVGERGWSVLVCGHSLGAAVAAMLSFHLRERFPSLRCFAFCPPGGLLSAPLRAVSLQFCTSVVVGTDAVSRVSFPNTQRLVDEMVLALARCKRPKLAVAADALGGRRRDPAATPPTFCSVSEIGPEAEAAVKKYAELSRLHASGADTTELYPPGSIIHLRPYAGPCHTESDKKGCRVFNKKKAPADVWDAAWTPGEKIMAEGLILGKAMVGHHRLPTLQAALRSAIAGEAAAGAKGTDAV